MVTFDLDVKAMIGLAENGNISESNFKANLEKFDKKDIIAYIMSDIYNTEGEGDDDKGDFSDEDY